MGLILPKNCFVVFVDDTGHEGLVEGHPAYGLGGCGINASALEVSVRRPWRDLRKLINGSADVPLHASEFTRNASDTQMNAVGEFFKREKFFRIGAAVSLKSQLPNEMCKVEILCSFLKNRIIDVAKYTNFEELQ